jgi:hypothetical protein
VAGALIGDTIFVLDKRATLGNTTPLLVAVISRAAAALGVAVLIPTFCEKNTDVNNKLNKPKSRFITTFLKSLLRFY